MKKKLKRPQQKSTKLKAGFLKKINKSDKPLARLIKKQREKKQINKIKKSKWRDHNSQHRKTKDHKRLLPAAVCQ